MAGQNQDRRNGGNRGDVKALGIVPFLVVAVIFLIVGIVVIVPSVPMFGIVWILFCVYFIVAPLKAALGKQNQRRKTDDRDVIQKPDPTRYGKPDPAKYAARPTGYDRVDRRVYQPSGQEHDHIRSIKLSPQRKLEQLETLKGAGLLTDEEYRDKKREIMQKL